MSFDRLDERGGVTDYFDSRSFYRFHHKIRPNEDLRIIDPDGDVDMSKFNTSSSENWQIYYQQGRWFIRPYASSATLSWKDYQLALMEDDRGNVGALPRVAKRSGELGHQWTFAQVDDGNGGFGYRISNGLLGNTSFLALTGDGGQPGMQSSSEGTIWDMQVNRQAGDPSMDNSYEDVTNFAVASTSVASLVSSTSTATASPSLSSTSSSTSTPTSSATGSASSSLSSGAIAGIVVGAVLVVLAAIGAYILYAKRRKRNASGDTYHEVELNQDSKVTYAQVKSPAELGSEPVVHMGGFQAERYELGDEAPSASVISEGSSVSANNVANGTRSRDGVR